MNNYIYGAPAESGEEKRIKGFRAAQNRVAFMMFLMLFIEIAASVLMVVLMMVFPKMQNDTFKYEFMQMLLYLLYIALPVFLFCIISGRSPGKYFCFRRGRKHTVAVGIAAMGAVYFAQLVAVIVSDLLGRAGANTDVGAFTDTADPAVLALRFVYLAILPAIFEELMTRGIVLGELLPYGKGFAIITSGLLFGLMHMNAIQLPFAFIAGTAMAYAVVYCGTLRVSMAVHFVNNFLSVFFTALPKFVSEETAFYIETVITVVIFAAGSAAVVWLIKHKDDEKEQSGGKLCTECGEPYKVDLREGALKKISPFLYVYAAISVLMTVYTLISTSVML